MREKLLDLMKNEGLKPSQLAEMLEINPAGISHILAGRNKPGFDLLQKILRRFPRINPDWLLLDAGTIYRPDADAMMHPRRQVEAAGSTSAGVVASTEFGSSEFRTAPATGNLFTSADSNASTLGFLQNSGATAKSPSDKPMQIPSSAESIIREHDASAKNAEVERVVVFYRDMTFESFTPKR